MLSIEEIRNQTGLSQKQFANEYHISVATLRRWEQGVSKVPDHYLYALNELVKYKGLLYGASTPSLDVRNLSKKDLSKRIVIRCKYQYLSDTKLDHDARKLCSPADLFRRYFNNDRLLPGIFLPEHTRTNINHEIPGANACVFVQGLEDLEKETSDENLILHDVIVMFDNEYLKQLGYSGDFCTSAYRMGPAIIRGLHDFKYKLPCDDDLHYPDIYGFSYSSYCTVHIAVRFFFVDHTAHVSKYAKDAFKEGFHIKSLSLWDALHAPKIDDNWFVC